MLFAIIDARYADNGAILQSANLYVYCTNNPVMFVDPSGLEIIIKGTPEDVDEIRKNLQMLTNDELQITQKKDENGNLLNEYVVSVKEEKKGELKYGTELIRRMLDDKETCIVQITTRGNYETDSDIANAINGVGSDASVYFNPNSNPDIMTEDPETGNVSYAKRPSYIGLAHELIHADRSMRGKAIDYSVDATYKYQINSTKTKILFFIPWTVRTYEKQTVKKEELATVGLDYYTRDDITENMIRGEHGLNLRGAY